MYDNWVFRQKVRMALHNGLATGGRTAGTIALGWRHHGMANLWLGMILILVLACMMTSILLVVIKPKTIVPWRLEGQVYNGPAYANASPQSSKAMASSGIVDFRWS
jgi:hypothetical protein